MNFKTLRKYIVLPALLLLGNTAGAAALNWDAGGGGGAITNGGGAWLGAGLWNNAGSAATWTSGDDATFGGPATAGGAVTLASPTTVNSLTFNSFTGTYTLGTAGQAITLNSGLTMNAGSGTVAFAGPVTLGAAQAWTNNSSSTLQVSGAQTVTNGGFDLTFAGTGTITMGPSGGNTLAISGLGGVIKNGTGRLIMGGNPAPAHSYTGTTTLNGGVTMFGGNLPGGNLTLNGGVYEEYWTTTFTRTLGSAAGQVQLTGGASGFSESGATGMTVRLNNSAVFEVVWGGALFNPTTLILQAASAQNGSSLTFDNKIDLNGATRTITSDATSTATATVAQAIRTSTGTAGLIKSGAGQIILSNASNTYNGGTTVNQGVLTATVTGALPGFATPGAVVVADGATIGVRTGASWTAGNIDTLRASATWSATGSRLGLDTTGGAFTYASNITEALSVYKLGGNNLTLTGVNTYTGKTFLGGGSVIVTSFGNVGDPSSPLGTNSTIEFLNGGNLSFTGSTVQTSDKTFNIAGTDGTLRADGTGAGTITLTADINPTSTANKTLSLFGANTNANTISGNISNGAGGTLGITKNLAGTWVLSGNNTYTGNTTVSAGTLELSGGSAIADTGTVNMTNAAGALVKLNASETVGSVTGGGALGGDVNIQNFDLTVQPTGAGTLTGDLIGTGGLIKRGSANYVLQGDNALFTGKTTVEVGYLVHDSLTADNGGGALALNGGNFSMGAMFAGQTLTIGSLSGNSASSQIDPNFGATTGIKTLSVNQTTDGTFAGKILIGSGSRNIALTKTGAATLILGGASTYTGSTTVSEGTLLVNGSTAAAGLVTVSSGATLGGNGSVGQVTVADGFLSPGHGLDNTFTVNSLTMDPTATLVLGLDDPFSFDGNDLVQITTSLTLAGQINIHAQPGGSGYDFLTATEGTQWLVMTYAPGNLLSAGDVTVGSAPALSSGLAWKVDTTTTDGSVYLTVVVPEPAAASLLAAGLLVVFLRRRRST